MKRRPTLELLDSDSGTPEEIARSLLDLRSFNRYLGGVSTTRDLIRVVARKTGKTNLSLLELAAGTGFVPLQSARDLRDESIKLDVTLLDRATTHLPQNGSATKIAGDALRAPLADSSFDLVSCSLFVHHLSPEVVVQFAREALRICRVAVLVNDLVRHPLHLALAYAGAPLYRSRITRNDAPASVRQSYTVEEMSALFRSVEVQVETRKHFLFRMGVIAWKSASETRYDF
jgi:ubiquinone/menaquinone biosynthesis C-methylase UbiE